MTTDSAPHKPSWLYLASIEDTSPESPEYVILDANTTGLWSQECQNVEELTWSGPRKNTSHRTLQIGPPIYNNNYSEWYNCAELWKPLQSPRSLTVVSMLPQVVLPSFRPMVGSSDLQSQLERNDPSQQSEIPHNNVVQSTALENLQIQSDDGSYAAHKSPQGEPAPTPSVPLISYQPTYTDSKSYSMVKLTIDNIVVTAVKSAADATVIQLDSATLTIGGLSYSTRGHIFSLASDGIHLDGVAAGLFSLRYRPISTAILTLGSESVTVSGLPESPKAALFGTTHFSVGGPAIDFSGHKVSLGTKGVVVDGTSTALFTTLEEPESTSTNAFSRGTFGKVETTPWPGEQVKISASHVETLDLWLFSSLFISCLTFITVAP
jgi:hypothetical protein